MVTKTSAIKNFLEVKAPPDLAALYSLAMECQVNVAQDGGERIDGEFKGRKWHGWTDGLTTWKSFRIPYKANTKPEYIDTEARFDLAEHAEGIGMTGWNWQELTSKWVAFDFDAILGHSEKHVAKLTSEQLAAVEQAAQDLEWVTIRKSSSGKGIHLYVFLPSVPTKNHHEHAALARAILGVMSGLAAFDFQSKVDICGGNMWVWHRKCEGTDGFALIKQGRPMLESEIPPNWKDHVKVVSRQRRKNLPQDLESPEEFEGLAGQRPRTPLDEEHRKLIQFLKDSEALWWWDQDHHMLVTHTFHLKQAHDDLSLKGYFNTMSKGREKGIDHNCFAFPLRQGGWAVRRYSRGVQEHPSWEQDGAGWTRCYLNREASLGTAARAFGGIEDPDGSFVFREAELAISAAQLLGVYVTVGGPQLRREARLKEHKDGRLIVSVDHDAHDRADEMELWQAKKGKWVRIYGARVSIPEEPEVGNYDDTVRHIVTSSDEDYGWVVRSDSRWRNEPLAHVRAALGSLGMSGKEVTGVLGSSIFKCWKLVNKPFQPEYPGDREWNYNAAQFKYPITRDKDNLTYPTWTKILEHCGTGLSDGLKNNTWAKANGILTGGDYLKCWVASLFQEPMEPLPYLFFYGPQNSGKSVFHEALSLLLTKGYQRADAALVSQAGFNGELEGAVLCVIEETDLHNNKIAYNRIKDWVTSRDLPMHLKGRTPYHTPNSTHWIQCANSHQSCPVFAGDTRITMCFVDDLDPLELIPKKQLMPMLQKEASDFLGEVMGLEIPPSPDRLNVPIIVTQDKEMAQVQNLSPLQQYIRECCQSCAGQKIKFSEFYASYAQWTEVNGETTWSKIKVGKEIPPQFPKGRDHGTGQFYIGNICFRGATVEKQPRLMLVGDYLERSKDA